MLEDLLIARGEPLVLAGAGALTGLVFGWAAQRSRFCLRAATVEVAEGVFGPKLDIWLVAFFAAMSLTQLGVTAGLFDVSSTRQLAAEGSSRRRQALVSNMLVRTCCQMPPGREGKGNKASDFC